MSGRVRNLLAIILALLLLAPVAGWAALAPAEPPEAKDGQPDSPPEPKPDEPKPDEPKPDEPKPDEPTGQPPPEEGKTPEAPKGEPAPEPPKERNAPSATAVGGSVLMVSSSSSRSGAAPLEGRTVEDDIHVFVSPETGVSKVTFWLDDPQQERAPHQTENGAPFDFAGGTTADANPFDTSRLPDGEHTVTARVELADGGTEIVSSTFTVDNVGSGGGGYELLLSGAPDRSSPAPLNGSRTTGDVYVFASPDAGATQARFYLDDPQRAGTPRRVENSPPRDFAGTAGDGRAQPFDTTELTDGDHTITAEVDLSAGGTEVLSATFTVTNGAPASLPAPTASPPAGTYPDTQSVTLSSGAGTQIRYTVDGTTPTAASTLYTGPITVSASQTVKAIAVDGAGNQSPVATHAYTIQGSPLSYADTVRATPGLVSYWRLGEPSSDGTARDDRGRNNGTYRNGVSRGVTGALVGDSDRAARFDGNDDHVTAADSASLDTGDSFTLEAWVKRSSASSSRSDRIFSKGNGSYVFGFTNNVLTLRKQVAADVVRANVSTTDTAGFHHVVATKSGATVKLYIDGVDRTGAVTDQTMANTSTALSIGQASDSSTRFPGTIDEPAIYSGALTAGQVVEHYEAGRRAPPPPPPPPPGSTVAFALGDGADGGTASRALANYVAAQNPDRFFYLGDVYDNGTATEFARNYDPLYGSMAAKTDPLLADHEYANRATGYFPYWRSKRGWTDDEALHRAYVDRSGWQVIAYASDANMTSEAAWVGNEIAKHPGTCRIVMGHRGRHPVVDSAHNDNVDQQPVWSKMVGTTTINLVGDNHVYGRLRPLDGINVFTSGAGGHGLRSLGTQHHPIAATKTGTPTATRLVLRSGAADFQQVDKDGNVYDSGTIPCTPAPAAP